MNDSVPVLSLPIKTTLDRFTFAVFLVAMQAAHNIVYIFKIHILSCLCFNCTT